MIQTILITLLILFIFIGIIYYLVYFIKLFIEYINRNKPLKPRKLSFNAFNTLDRILYLTYDPYAWKMRYYDLKQYLWSLKTYHKIVKQMVPYDYHSIVSMLDFQIRILKNRMEKGYEVDETLNPKLIDMERLLTLLNNKIEDDYMERCGYKHNEKDFEFIPSPDRPNSYMLVDNDTEEEKQIQRDIFKRGYELEENEWSQICELLKNMRSWWC